MGLFGLGHNHKHDEEKKRQQEEYARQQAAAQAARQAQAEKQDSEANMEKIERTIDTITKRAETYEKKAFAEGEKAKQLMSQGNKSGALQCMKHKKQFEQQAEQQNAQLNNLETIRSKLQESAMNSEVVEANRIGAQQMQDMNKKMNADQIMDQKDQLQDAMDQQAEVAQALGEQLDGGHAVQDEDDLMGELNGIMSNDQGKKTQQDQELEAQLAGMTSAPTGALAGGQKPAAAKPGSAEAELAALEAGMQ